jgi:O-antigen ligase
MNKRLDLFDLSQFYFFGITLLVGIIAGTVTDNALWYVLPFVTIGVYLGINSIHTLYYALCFFIPISVEATLPGGFGIDFPDELFIVGLMILTIGLLMANRKNYPKALHLNPVTSILFIQFLWIIISTIFSSNIYVSLKFTLSKFWYLTTFVVLTAMIIKSVDDFKKIFWLITLPLFLTTIYTLVRHYRVGFSFADVNHTMAPFFRNHVSYAAMLSEWIPFVLLGLMWYKRYSIGRQLLLIILPVLVTGVFFAYTRSAWLALLAAFGIQIIIRLRLTKWIVATTVVSACLALFVLSRNYYYINYAPNYESTIYHEDLGAHLSSTYKMEDISSAERIYRWVAGLRMSAAEPVHGFGPGNFYNFYKGYTVSAFRTYVSSNPERSTVHNYFILMLVEQGIIGLLLYTLLTISVFIYGEYLFHRLKERNDRMWIMAILMSMTAILVNNTLSDMIETDKVGSVYYINIAMLAVLGYKHYLSEKSGSQETNVVVKN